MHSSSPVKIYCANHLCQALNPEINQSCDRCRAFLPKRYLWVVGDGADTLPVGALLADRYQVKMSRIVVDTKPGFMPQSPPEITTEIEPYLRLCAHQPQVPQVYSQIPALDRPGSFLLLENAPVYSDGLVGRDAALAGTLMPTMAAVWPTSSALRQLNWLWQLVQLWQPLRQEGVVRTLLEPEFLRVEESLLRVLQLRPDRTYSPTLEDLGQSWQKWVTASHPDIAMFLGELSQQLVRGKVSTPEVLTELLDRAIAACGQYHRLDLAMLSDQGPSRQRNEDACFPPSGTISMVQLGGETASSTLPLVLVCDGIGGHEGGNVASNLAIETIQQQLKSLLQLTQPLEPSTIQNALRQAILAANDVISQRNDSEQRQDRQRMGTTLVLAFGAGHELYLAHVGDSRAYRITRTGCHQVTLDDDLASREVRLGYGLYRDALQQPAAGSLIQALGMSGSSLLHPTIQRFILDEDCLFLLCSDGLSDYDRVLEHYQAELVPVLDRQLDLATASQRLVTIANQKNGHDNVTVGLILCRSSDQPSPQSYSQALAANLQKTPVANARSAPELAPTLNLSVTRPQASRQWLWILAGLLLLGLMGGLVALLPDWLFSRQQPTPSLSPTLSPTISPTPEMALPTPLELSVNDIIQIHAGEDATASPTSISLIAQPDGSPTASTAQWVPPGSILQVAGRRQAANSNIWVQLKVCSVPNEIIQPRPSAPSTVAVAPIGSMGWITETSLLSHVTHHLNLTEAERGACASGALPSEPAPPRVPPTPSDRP